MYESETGVGRHRGNGRRARISPLGVSVCAAPECFAAELPTRPIEASAACRLPTCSCMPPRPCSAHTGLCRTCCAALRLLPRQAARPRRLRLLLPSARVHAPALTHPLCTTQGYVAPAACYPGRPTHQPPPMPPTQANPPRPPQSTHPFACPAASCRARGRRPASRPRPTPASPAPHELLPRPLLPAPPPTTAVAPAAAPPAAAAPLLHHGRRGVPQDDRAQLHPAARRGAGAAGGEAPGVWPRRRRLHRRRHPRHHGPGG